MFTIQAPFNAQNTRVYNRRGKRQVRSERLLIPRSNFSRKLMVSVGIGWNGKTRLVIIPQNERINAAVYQQILSDQLLPDCRTIYPRNGYVFQQDSARPHTAHETLALLRREAPSIITPEEWPAQSPDLNPCDYRLWAYLQEEVYKEGHCQTVGELTGRLRRAWELLPVALIRTWIEEWRPRLQAVVDNNGRQIQHLFNRI
uniref:Transposase n=2 Tax=Plectus sambesii TaxID=2011161 RepID=A0A914V3S5_9BILA